MNKKPDIELFVRAYIEKDLLVYEVIEEAKTKIIFNQMTNPAYKIYHVLDSKIDELVRKKNPGIFQDFKEFFEIESKRFIKKLYYTDFDKSQVKEKVISTSIFYKPIKATCDNCLRIYTENDKEKCELKYKIPKKFCRAFIEK